MNISVEHLDSLVMYVGLFVFATPLLMWLFSRVAQPAAVLSWTTESLADRMVPIARHSLHNLGVNLRHGDKRRLPEDRRLGLDRRNFQVAALAT